MSGVEPALAGRTIVLTRAREQAEGTALALSELGARVIELPLFRREPGAELDGAIQAVADAGPSDWLIFTSANAVAALLEHSASCIPHLQRIRVAAVGAETARVLRPHGVSPVLVPARAGGAELAAELIPYGPARVIWLRAERYAPELGSRLVAAGWRVDPFTVYSMVREQLDRSALERLASGIREQPTIAMVLSGAVAEALSAVLRDAGVDTGELEAVAALGARVGARCKELGFERVIDAPDADLGQLLVALTQWGREHPLCGRSFES